MKNILTIIILLLGHITYAQNIMILKDAVGDANENITLSIEIENTAAFVAFQFEIQLPDQIEYIEESVLLSSRSDDHQISASINNNTLTIFAYSFSQTEFSGNSGEVCSFELKLGSNPGDYLLELQNAIIGNSQSQNIISGVTNGTATINAPDIDIVITHLDYSRVPLTQSSDMAFNISNNGNSNLSINRIYTSNSDFEIIGDTTMTIINGNSQQITIRFNSNIKGVWDEQAIIINNDPDEPILYVDLHAVAYAVNELKVNNMFGRSGYESTMEIDISNTEAFVAFSYDIEIPEVITYVPNSISFTGRESDHIVSASILENGNVRVVSYSPTNSVFSGNTGNIITLDFLVDGTGGWYNINILDPIIGDANQDNILSDSYNGSLEIAAPDIHLNSNILDFGAVSIFDTAEINMVINNYGSDTLIINNLSFFDSEFYSDVQLPVNLPPSQNIEIPVCFHSGVVGEFLSNVWIRSNDTDEDPKNIELQAHTFIPNVLRVDSTILQPTDTGWVSVSIDNNESFVGFQFDMIVPEGFNYLDEVQLSDRANNHQVSASMISSDTLRVFAYSMSQLEFSGNHGSIISIKFEAPDLNGDYLFELNNVVIGNASSQNIISSYESGNVSVYSLPTASLSESAIICYGETTDILILFTGTAPWNFTYTDGITPITIITNVNPYVFTVSTAGNYEITALSDANCSGSDFGESILVIVKTLPDAEIISNNEICFGETLELVAIGGSEYLWNTDEINDTIFISPEENTVYSVTVTENGCSDSTDVEVIVNPVYSIQTEETICEGDSLLWEGIYYFNEGTYDSTFATVSGCDSTIELILSVVSQYSFEESENICEGQSFSWQGQSYTEAGTYYAEYTSDFGCDSIYELTLEVNPSYFYTEQKSICEGDSILWHKKYYSISGSYLENFETEFGCDSIYELELTVNLLPIAEFTYKIIDLTVTFTNTSSNANSYLWDFGDGNTDTIKNPTYTYLSADNYLVKLIAYNDNCEGVTKEQSINFITYIVTFTVTNGTNAIEGATVSLTGYSNITTNSSGIAVFENIIPATDIAYTITATNYENSTGYISVVDTDINEDVNMFVTNIESVKNDLFNIYPNPTTGLLNIEFAKNNIQQIVISDLTGKVIIEKQKINQKETIDLSNLEKGIYIISMQTDNNTTITTKIVKE